MKSITILGATGSVGGSTADVIRAHPGRYRVKAVTAHSRAAKLAETARALNAEQAVIADESGYAELKSQLFGSGIKCAAGGTALNEAAAMPVDWTMASIVGMAGLQPLMKAVERGGQIAIANKEPLVAAGPFLMDAARRSGATLLPVDSEHNAIFQVFDPANKAAVERIIITASGGPFRTVPLEKLGAVTPEQALAHPNWSMGPKVSVDSATMMNKALEIIEAHYLFAMPASRIDVLVHPQSVVHSMVEYSDGSVLAQMGASDMRTPIAHALGWPERISTPGHRLDFKTMKSLTFEDVDREKFPAVGLAYQCIENGLGAQIAFNAANEVAVEAFLCHNIAYLGIMNVVGDILSAGGYAAPRTLDDVFALDGEIRRKAVSMVNDATRNVRKAL